MEGQKVATNGSSAIEDWLRSLSLVHYTQAFLDNGYDDLEICKQIGHPDLDAIGVAKEDHRKDILKAVEALKQQGSHHVYFILETPDSQTNGGESYRRSLLQNGEDRDFGGESERVTDEYAEGRRAFKTFPKIHLSAIVRSKLVKHRIKLTEKPFIYEDGSVNQEELEKIAHQYAQELKTHPKDVLDRLHEFLDMASTQSAEEDRDSENHVPGDDFSLYSVGGQTSRSKPPPLPLCPPPSHSSRHTSMSEQGSPRHSSPSKSRSRSSDSRMTQHMESLEEISILEPGTEPGDRSNKYSDTLSRILKSVKSKSTKKYSYKKVEGDLNASEITMSDEERIHLMIMVKEGKISMEEVMHLVKQYETEKRLQRQSSLAGSSEVSISVSPSPSPQQKRNSKFSPFLLFKFGSQRKKKNSLSQGESSNSSLTSSPELSARQSVHFEGTGTQMYSPIQGIRKKIAPTDVKAKSSILFSSPTLSPHRGSRMDKVTAEFHLESPKEKKKGTFNSPFSKRKKSPTLSKGSCESPRASQSSVDRIGALDSPTGSRRGSLNHLSDKRTKIPSLSRAMSQDCSKPPPSSVQQETVAIVHFSPQRKIVHQCDKYDEVAASSDVHSNTSDNKLVSFKGYGLKHGETCGHAQSDTTVNAICKDTNNHSPKLKQSISSDNYEYAHEIDSHSKIASHKSRNAGIQSTDFKCMECGTNHPKRLSHPLGYCVFAMKDAMSSKRRNAPSGTPPETQSPKRQHFSSSPDCTIMKREISQKQSHTSSEHGTETSPTGTLDSSSMREGHYGSNSTMSVGSETSPSCTIERTTLKPVTKKLVKRTLDKQAPGVRIRSNSFSAGDDYLSSDQEDILKGSHKVFSKSQIKRHSLTERSEVKVSEHHSDHSVEMPSDPDMKSSLTTPKGESSSESRSSPSVEEDRVRSKVKTRTRPQTVEALLTRLNIQHLIPIFVKHGYTTLRMLSNLEEDHLNDLSVENPEERAKLLTAAQMISDFEDQSSSYHVTSESGHSSQCNSPCRLSTGVANERTHYKTTTESRVVTAKDNEQSPSKSDNIPLIHQSETLTQKSNSASASPTQNVCLDKVGLPMYENIDNFENAIPMNELVLCNRGCQSDLSSMDGLHVILRDSHEDVSDITTYYGNGTTVETFSVNHTGAKCVTSTTRMKPQVPERTVSLGSENGSKTLGTAAGLCRDASTQHGGVLQSLKKQSSSGSLIHTSPVSGKAKVKTAEVRHLHHVSSPKDSQTCPRHSSIHRLCPQHRKARQTTPEKLLHSVQHRLHKECIDLTALPYSLQDGSCGIPVLLVQRYAEELQADLYEVATVFEAIRTNALHTQAREVIVSRDLGDKCLSPAAEPQLNSVPDFLVFLGLPIYCELFSRHNVHSMEQLLNNVHTEDLVHYGITDPTHIRKLRHWMKKVRHGLASGKQTPADGCRGVSATQTFTDKV